MKQHELAFYSTVAQVLPVLIVVATVELRILLPRQKGKTSRIRSLAVMAFAPVALSAEMVSFNVLLTGDPPNGVEVAVVKVALWVGVLLVFLAPGLAHSLLMDREYMKQKSDRARATRS